VTSKPQPKIFRGISQVPSDLGSAAVTIGVFDGVHRGHRALARRVVEIANGDNLVPVVVTFDRHPVELIAPEHAPKLLSSVEERAAKFAELGIQALVVLTFDEEMRNMDPTAFVRDILIDRIGARQIVIGANFKFGRDQKGTIETLNDLAPIEGFEVNIFALQMDDSEIVSSSLIRRLVADGKVEEAAEKLDAPFTLTGTVEHGAGRGDGLGYPTANLQVDPRRLIPAMGVYCGWAVLQNGDRHPMAVNVGLNPTFDDRTDPVVEAFLLDFKADLYGQPLQLEFVTRLRDELRFESAQELVQQIEQDVARSRKILGV
jgi:riboflavin kinase / FMN adenylyltransferase